MNYNTVIKIKNIEIGPYKPTYFIADIASNHDRDINRAKDLIWRAKESGAHAAKFQHFKAEKLVSERGFNKVATQAAHQLSWGSSVFDVYQANEYNREWDSILHEECGRADIHFMTSPYDLEAIKEVETLVAGYKIGSGDITYPNILKKISERELPIFLACGASSLVDVRRAVDLILRNSPQLVLMQCNTNYTGSNKNFNHINLRVLNTFSQIWPNMVLGLSDHTIGHSTVLAAVALGARCIEKHFTDDTSRRGPDHPFSMTPKAWREMVDRTQEVEKALGDGIKRVEDNELETSVAQRRGLYLTRQLDSGVCIKHSDLESLRPALEGMFYPYEIEEVVGRVLLKKKSKGDPLQKSDLKIG